MADSLDRRIVLEVRGRGRCGRRTERGRQPHAPGCGGRFEAVVQDFSRRVVVPSHDQRQEDDDQSRLPRRRQARFRHRRRSSTSISSSWTRHATPPTSRSSKSGARTTASTSVLIMCDSEGDLGDPTPQPAPRPSRTITNGSTRPSSWVATRSASTPARPVPTKSSRSWPPTA